MNLVGSAMTVAIWVYQTGAGTNCPRLIDGGNVNSQYTLVAQCGNILYRPVTSGGLGDTNSGSFSYNTWHLVVATYDGSSTHLYIDGTQVASTSINGNLQVSGTDAFIGGDNSPSYFVGDLANGQVYGTALSSAQVTQLYDEGLEGAPISGAGLVAWWPLEGNAIDATGNGNNGAPQGTVTYVSPPAPLPP
jgi:hypothetical protein